MYKDAIKRLAETGQIAKYNPAVAEGIGYSQAGDGIHNRIHTILNRELNYHPISNPRLPKELKYCGFRFLSPFESYIYKINRTGGRGRKKTMVPIAKTDTYMISVKFTIPGGERVTRPLNVPFIRRGSLMYSWGSCYHVATVIHQPGICRETDGYFVNFDFTRKVNFKFCGHTVKMFVNGRLQELFIPGVKNLYSGKSSTGHDTDGKPLSYWVFGRHGFSNAVKRYTGASVEIRHVDDIATADHDKYVVLQSGDYKYGRNIRYCLFVDKASLPSADKNEWTQKEHVLLVMLAAFFKAASYYASHQTNRDESKNLPPLFTKHDEFQEDGDILNLDSADCWKEILGRSISGTVPSDFEILRRTESHFLECERYISSQFRGELMLNDDNITQDFDMFDFMFYITDLMTRTRLQRIDDIPSLYNKRLTVTDYLLMTQFGFTSTVSNLRWEFEGYEAKDRGSRSENFRTSLQRQLSTSVVTKGITKLPFVTYFNASSESMVLTCSTHAVSQTETDPERRKAKTVNLNDRTKHGSASHIELGGIYYIPKSSPFKYGVLNPYMRLDKKFTMVRNPKLAKVIEEAETDIAQIGK